MNETVTPNIAAFAASGFRFTRHFSGGNATRIGMFSLFYGIPGTYWHSALASGVRPALVERLETLGYQMAVFRSAPLSSPEFHRTLFDGVDDLRMTSEGRSSAARDQDATADFLSFLEAREPGRPLFALLFLDAPHAYDLLPGSPRPFQPSWEDVNYLTLDGGTDPEPFRNLYRNSVHFVDALVAGALAEFGPGGSLEDAIVVITGDHGQEFNDTGLGYWGHNGNFSRFQTQVPFIVRWPGKGAGRIDHLTSHFDVAPTLLDEALGVDDAYARTSVGANLFRADDRLPLILSMYRGFAVLTAEGYVLFPPFGGAQLLDHEYRPVARPPSAGIIEATLARLGGFRG